MVIGLPPVMNFGSPELQAKVVPDVLAGKKFISLAISEAFAGSDVAGLKCTAKKTEDGKHFIINGTKKWVSYFFVSLSIFGNFVRQHADLFFHRWITNGTFSDYFTVACNTGQGLTVFLVERQEGVETKPIKTAYSPAAGTAFITFDDVKVPVENMLGSENGGLLVVLSNFNHERWVMCASSARSQRTIVEECLKCVLFSVKLTKLVGNLLMCCRWCHQRQVFGKPLLNQPVIRYKLAAMIARVESVQNWLENVTFQMCQMVNFRSFPFRARTMLMFMQNYNQQSSYLAGQIAFLKMYSTRSAQLTAQDATQVFGGRGITRTGMGRHVEHYHQTVGFDALLGGAEDVLGDLCVRQAMRKIPKNTRL